VPHTTGPGLLIGNVGWGVSGPLETIS
jgi:hypothetical protein